MRAVTVSVVGYQRGKRGAKVYWIEFAGPGARGYREESPDLSRAELHALYVQCATMLGLPAMPDPHRGES